jgi:protocatechuate 3,4-dioxygenase beta subunit
MRSLAVLLVIPLALSAQPTFAVGQPNRPAPPPSPPQDLCTVEGQVFDASTGQPLRKATISMNGVHSYGATTDAAGKFSVSGIEPGQYRVNATHTGFLNAQYNARRSDGPGTQLELARGQKMTGVDFRLTPHGVIAGRMLDEDGDPLQNVQIQLLRMTYARGRKQLQQYNGGNSNDLGEYRISGIQPGKYYLCAIYRGRLNMIVMNGNISAGGGPTQQQEDYAATFYPGVTDVAAAVPMDMKPGQQLQGINLKLTKIHTVSVKGTVINTTAPPAVSEQLSGRGGPVRINNVNLQLEPRNSLNPPGMAQGTGVRPDGTFEFPSIAPGSYNLVAMTNSGNLRHATMLPIDVGNANVEGLTLTINPGVTVSGHIRVDGETTDPIPSFQVRLNPWAPGFNVGPPQPAKADASNNFSFDDVNPEHFEVNVSPLPGTLYLKSIRAGNTDVLANGLDLTGGGGASLDVVIGVNAPQITGTVQNPTTQQPAIAVTVVLIPQEKERREASLYYRTANTDQNGNFTMARVNPGEYKVYAWEDVENGAWFDPDFLKPVESKGSPVSMREGSPVSVQVTMIPAGSGN